MSSIHITNPYYIIAPRYIRTSGGVRVLYRLADLINKTGGSAYIFLWPYYNHDLSSSPMDVAPFLNKKIADYHYDNGLTPIVIYPEAVAASKFSPPFRVRYLLNYNELLFKNEPLENDDYILSYSDAISRQVDIEKPSCTLFLPVSDTVFFSPPKEPVNRKGAAYYAGKYKYLFNGKTFPVTDGLPEITRDRPDSQTPEQIRSIFHHSEYFYSYEDSALALEAILCGCPAVFLPNKHFKEPLGAKELNGLGFAWGDSPEQLLHAKETVGEARIEHLRRVNEIQKQIAVFVTETQELVKNIEYIQPFAEQYLRSPSIIRKIADSLRLLVDVYKDKGILNTTRVILKRLRSRRTTI